MPPKKNDPGICRRCPYPRGHATLHAWEPLRPGETGSDRDRQAALYLSEREVAKRIAAIVHEHLDTLPPADRKTMRAAFRKALRDG